MITIAMLSTAALVSFIPAFRGWYGRAIYWRGESDYFDALRWRTWTYPGTMARHMNDLRLAVADVWMEVGLDLAARRER